MNHQTTNSPAKKRLSNRMTLLIILESLIASGLGICFGNSWLAAMAMPLIGVSTLLPAFIDYRQTKQALQEARRQAAKAHTVELATPERLTYWPEFVSRSVH